MGRCMEGLTRLGEGVIIAQRHTRVMKVLYSVEGASLRTYAKDDEACRE
jgi:hypothetical protein